MPPILDPQRPPVQATGPGPIDVRTQGNGPAPPPLPPRRRPLAEILADQGLGNGAKLLARHLDGWCLAYGKWAAWPKVSTIADELGWGGDPKAFRKRVERAFRELVRAGDVARPRLGELVAWHEADGARNGLAWPKGLRRNLCRSAAISVLGWKLAEAEGEAGTIPPSLTACDIGVASTPPPATPVAPRNVASHPPGMSHGDPPEMSHPQNVRNWNVATEPTLNVAARAPGDGEPPADADPAPGGEATPAAVGAIATGDLPPAAAYTPQELARTFVERRLRDRGIYPEVGDKDGVEVIRFTRAGQALLEADPATVAELKARRLEVIAYLTGRAGSTGAAAGPPAGPPAPEAEARPAPRVSNSHRVRARDRIGRLAGNLDPAAEEDAARAIADALGDHQPETLETLKGQAGSVRRGELAEAIVQEAFEEACGRTARNRGAVYMAAVNRKIASAKSPARPSAGRVP